MDPILIKRYAEFLKSSGYSRDTIRIYCKALEQVPDAWDNQVPSELYQHIINDLNFDENLSQNSATRCIKPASKLFFLMISGISFKDYAKKNIASTEYSYIINEFYVYSTEFKTMTKPSAQAECVHVATFLDYIGKAPDPWLEITAENVRDYSTLVLSKLRLSSKGRYVTSIRNFFRFLQYKGIEINQSVLELPLIPANWNKSTVPITLTHDEEERIRSHFDIDTHLGKRNTIIIRLMLDLGMRCVEVSTLKLSDIKWNSGTILIKNTKNNRNRELPLSQDLGLLIEDYVINYRKNISDPSLLQRKTKKNKYIAMTNENVRRVVRSAFEKENITGWWQGTHTLRRTAASRMYNSGNDLKLTADILGHESVESTTQYVRVDFESLRKVSSPWPGSDYNE